MCTDTISVHEPKTVSTSVSHIPINYIELSLFLHSKYILEENPIFCLILEVYLDHFKMKQKLYNILLYTVKLLEVQPGTHGLGLSNEPVHKPYIEELFPTQICQESLKIFNLLENVA